MKNNRRSANRDGNPYNGGFANGHDSSVPLVQVTVHTFDNDSDREDLMGERDIERLARHEWDGTSRPDTGHDYIDSTRTTIQKR